MDRRKFIKNSVFTTGGISLLGLGLNSCNNLEHLKDIGIITNTISKPMEEDWEGTLRKMASFGYKYLEHGKVYGGDLKYFKSFMTDIGMKSLAGGADIKSMDGDKLNLQIEKCHDLEKEYLICYWPWRKAFEETTLDDLKLIVDDLNKIGMKCREQGLNFAFHNHDMEFVELEGEVIYDFFLNNTDPLLVDMQADVYWMTKGGADPVHYFKKYPGRFPILHMKDMNNLDEKDFACVGSGVIDFQRIINNSLTAGVKYLVVEHDHPVNHMECAESSIEHLLTLKY